MSPLIEAWLIAERKSAISRLASIDLDTNAAVVEASKYQERIRMADQMLDPEFLTRLENADAKRKH